MKATRRALIVRGGWAGHQPDSATDLFIPFLESSGFRVEVADKPAVYTDAELMDATDLIVHCVSTGGLSTATIERDEVQGLRAAVAAGVGLAGWHGGIVDSYRQSPEFLQLIGGQFVAHPGNGRESFVPHRIDVRPSAAEHPITFGISSFDLVTEQYWVLSDDYNDVLATTTLAPGTGRPWTRPVTTPAVWTRKWGRGKVFVATPGHSLDILQTPQVRTIIERGLRWASR